MLKFLKQNLAVGQPLQVKCGVVQSCIFFCLCWASVGCSTQICVCTGLYISHMDELCVGFDEHETVNCIFLHVFFMLLYTQQDALGSTHSPRKHANEIWNVHEPRLSLFGNHFWVLCCPMIVFTIQREGGDSYRAFMSAIVAAWLSRGFWLRHTSLELG